MALNPPVGPARGLPSQPPTPQREEEDVLVSQETFINVQSVKPLG